VTTSKTHWSEYWRQGNLTSLPRGFANNYDGEFVSFWEAEFARLQAGSRVLDVCSGNGSIALLAQDYSSREHLNFQVKASDAAQTDVSALIRSRPHFREHIEAIEFIPDSRVEILQEAAASVDLVSSQFGIEYTDWRVSAANIHRMLKPGGHFAMVCHSCDSKILREMELQQAQYEQIAHIALFSAVHTDVKAPGFAADFPQKLEATLDELYQLFQKRRASQLLSTAGKKLEQIRSLALRQPDDGLREFVHFRDAINTSRGVAADLLAVNHALRGSPHWHDAFTDAGLELLDSGTIRYRTGEIAGSSYRFIKPG